MRTFHIDFHVTQYSGIVFRKVTRLEIPTISTAQANFSGVKVTPTNAAPTRCADHALTKTLPGLCDEFPAEQSECGSRDMNEREHRCSGLLTAPVAVAVASIEHVSDLEAGRIAGTPASQQNVAHDGLHPNSSIK